MNHSEAHMRGSNALHILPFEGNSVVFWGLGTTYKVRSESMGGSVAVVEHTLEPGWLGAPPHRHKHEEELSYVLEGELTVEQMGEVTVASAGSYVLKPRGIFHSFWNSGTDTVRFVEIITPGGFEHYFEELAPFFPPNVAEPQWEGAAAVAVKFGLEFDLSRVAEIVERYGLKAGRRPTSRT